MTALRMPDLGTVEGTVILVRWLKREGDAVALGEPLFEVETDKGVSEVESALEGVLAKCLIAEGATAAAGDSIAFVETASDREEEPAPSGGEVAAPDREQSTEYDLVRHATEVPPASGHRIAPSVRALAKKRGIDLESIKGSGPDGAITRADVLNVKEGRPESSTNSGSAARQQDSLSVDLALSPSQAFVARRVSLSHAEKPVYHVTARVDMSAAIALRGAARQSAGGTAVSYDSILVKAVGIAITEMPVFRSYLRGADFLRHETVDVAVAVGIGDDLYIPAVRDAGSKGLQEIAREIEELSKKAKERSLTAKETEGSCFLVSNLGMLSIEGFDAIIYPEHSAALAMGCITHTPVSDGTKIWIAPLVRLTLSVDHRLINGKTAGRFLVRVKDVLEGGMFA